jgi:hypothetical protein
MSAEELLRFCDTDAPEIGDLVCLVYIYGVLDAVQLFRPNPLHCVPHGLPPETLLGRLSTAQLERAVRDLVEEIELGRPRLDLSETGAAQFVYWAFTTTITWAEPTSYSCPAD